MNVVEVVRGDVVEARHVVQVAVADARGRLVASVGDVSAINYFRSAAKPMQALPLVEEGISDRLGISAEELALCCGSHEGEPEHVAGARSILSKAGVGEDMLRCGPHMPYSASSSEALLRAGGSPGSIHNNCSGKHAGMLALAVGMGWDPTDYHLPDHPVQRRMMAEVVRWTEVEESAVPTGVDGCGVVCFAAELRVMAASFARFAAAAREGAGPGRIVDAMTRHPFMVAGTGRTCTDVMTVAAGRVFVKVGAEGTYCGGIPEECLGLAIKVVDGGRRGVEVALVAVLESLGVLSSDDVHALGHHANPIVLNTLESAVGEIRPAFELTSHPS